MEEIKLKKDFSGTRIIIFQKNLGPSGETWMGDIILKAEVIQLEGWRAALRVAVEVLGKSSFAMMGGSPSRVKEEKFYIIDEGDISVLIKMAEAKTRPKKTKKGEEEDLALAEAFTKGPRPY